MVNILIRDIILKGVYIFIVFVLSLFYVNGLSKEVLNIEYVFDDLEGFLITDIYVQSGYPDNDNLNGAYYIKTLDNGGNVVDKLRFDINQVQLVPDDSWFDEDGNQIYFPENDKAYGRGLLKLPYYENLRAVEITDVYGNRLLIEDLRYYLGENVENVNLEVLIPKKENSISMNIFTSFMFIGGILFFLILVIFTIRKLKSN